MRVTEIIHNLTRLKGGECQLCAFSLAVKMYRNITQIIMRCTQTQELFTSKIFPLGTYYKICVQLLCYPVKVGAAVSFLFLAFDDIAKPGWQCIFTV